LKFKTEINYHPASGLKLESVEPITSGTSNTTPNMKTNTNTLVLWFMFIIYVVVSNSQWSDKDTTPDLLDIPQERSKKSHFANQKANPKIIWE